MASYTGSVTTSGNSRALRVEKAFFQANPEFAQQNKVVVYEIGPGTVLVKAIDALGDDGEEDPVMATFLSFLDNDIKNHPTRVTPLDEELWAEIDKLVDGVKFVEDDNTDS
ncbi:type II toxin-antitoxin system PrlF family antitoxin [Gloeobacter morelensis]|uniref:Type II toxin-antitoxin system PrlF family antitoxin n=1 Tax=Gloeobacter morelensis MG652769 TaxID=2781736 RepID=A0ABY3PHZ8_9CYAN|nr:type II toxin-antitoxin system PrlF family antitoxin [Gloeobacter morelensis]UFP93292.1 type II toxin-antitoxin system PrlF family antitoxin [Gloeobacter morelensis MG652769]